MPQISREEFRAAPLPVYWVRVNLGSFQPPEQELILKWLEANTVGWFFPDGNYFTFQHQSDRAAFALWLKCDPFNKEYGAVE